jgi:hypothetical protein
MGVRHGPRGQVVRLLKLVFHFIFNPTKHNTDTLASSGEAPSKIGQSLTEAISYQVRPAASCHRALRTLHWRGLACT